MYITTSPGIRPSFTKRAKQHFAGDLEYEYYKSKLKTFPAASVANLAHVRRLEVEEYPENNGHIRLAKAFALKDKHIQWFNTKVLELLKLKQTDTDTAEEWLSDLRVAMEETLTAHGYDELGNKKLDKKG